MRFLVFYTLLVLMGCSDKSSQKLIKNSINPEKSLTNDSSWTKRLSVALNLPRIDQGVDSFELRLWSSLSKADLQILNIISFTGGDWHCTESRYWIGKIDEWGKNRSLWADSIRTKKVLPTIPYEALLDSLQIHNVWNMPLQRDIPDFVEKTADGMTYTLEIAGTKSYHSITYRNPQSYSDRANKNFHSILKLLNKSIGAFYIP